MDKRELHDGITEIVGRSLYNFDLPQGATYEQLTDDSWLDKYQGRILNAKTWSTVEIPDSSQFRAKVDCLTAVLLDYIDRKVLDSH